MNENLEKMWPLVDAYNKAFPKQHLGTLDVRVDLSEKNLRQRIQKAIDDGQPIDFSDASFFHQYAEDEMS